LSAVLPGARVDVQRVAARLKAATEVLSYRQIFDQFLTALSGQHFLPQDTVGTLQDALQGVLNDNFSLAEVEPALLTIKRSVCDMSAAHLAFFVEIQIRSGLLDFLSSFDSPKLGAAAFERQAEVVTAQMQGREQESDIINTLVTVEHWLRPFATRRRPRFDNMAQLAAACMTSSTAEIVSRTAVVHGLAEHVTLLKMLFSDSSGEGAHELLIRVSSPTAKACFVSTLGTMSDSPGALELVYYATKTATAPQKMGPEHLAELVRSAALATPTEDQRSGVENFVRSFYVAVRALLD
jgi:hypothetical protein